MGKTGRLNVGCRSGVTGTGTLAGKDGLRRFPMAEIISLNHWRQSRGNIAAVASPQALARALDHIALDIRAAGHRLAADLVWMAAEDLRKTERKGRGEAATESRTGPPDMTDGEVKNPQ
jgi:hypothetical protein